MNWVRLLVNLMLGLGLLVYGVLVTIVLLQMLALGMPMDTIIAIAVGLMATLGPIMTLRYYREPR